MADMASEWLPRQLTKMIRMRPDLVMPVPDRALREDEAFRWAMVVGAYLDEQINLGKAAELLGMHRLELEHQFSQKGIPIRIGPESPEEARADVEAWTAWTKEKP